jgi:hypothetical protein
MATDGNGSIRAVRRYHACRGVIAAMQLKHKPQPRDTDTLDRQYL